MLAGGVQAAAADIAFGLKAVQLDGFVVIGQGLCGVLQEEVGGATVQVGGRVLGLLADVFVEIGHSALELAAQEVGYAAGEIQAGSARTKFDGPFQVAEGLVVISSAALRDGPVMVAGSEYGVQANGGGEIGLGAADVAQVVFGDTAVEEGPVVGGIQLGQHVEMGHGLVEAAILQGAAATEREYFLVVLGTGRYRHEECQNNQE